MCNSYNGFFCSRNLLTFKSKLIKQVQVPFKKFTDYLLLEKHYSEHTVKAYLNDLETFSVFAKEHYGYDDIKEVNYGVIRSWIVSLVDSGIANRSVNRKVSSLKTYYKFLLKPSRLKLHLWRNIKH